MRIAIISTYPPGTGHLNEFGFHFVNHLRQKPEVSEVILLADHLPDGQNYPPDDDTHGIAPLRIRPCWRFGAWTNTLTIRQAAAEANADVVLFNLQFTTFANRRIPGALGLLAPWAVKSTGPLTVVLLHNIMETVDLAKAGVAGNSLMERITRFFGTRVTRMLLQADLVAVTIPKYVDILTSKYEAEHVFLAPHGAFEQMPESSYTLPDGPLQIMTFGKFGTYQKVEKLIEAFNILQKQSDQPFELVIAGTNSPNTPGYLENVQKQYAHVSNVRYTGHIDEADVPRIFAEAAVVVFPHNSNTGSSSVLHQAGSYGKAIALPNLNDFTELSKAEGYTGSFFVPENAPSMAAAIRQLIISPQHRQQIGRRNFLASNSLLMSEVVDWYLLHIERLLVERSTVPISATQEAN
ncbi:MAG: glycosyltransferase [Chloroflexota bacterium]